MLNSTTAPLYETIPTFPYIHRGVRLGCSYSKATAESLFKMWRTDRNDSHLARPGTPRDSFTWLRKHSTVSKRGGRNVDLQWNLFYRLTGMLYSILFPVFFFPPPSLSLSCLSYTTPSKTLEILRTLTTKTWKCSPVHGNFKNFYSK